MNKLIKIIKRRSFIKGIALSPFAAIAWFSTSAATDNRSNEHANNRSFNPRLTRVIYPTRTNGVKLVFIKEGGLKAYRGNPEPENKNYLLMNDMASVIYQYCNGKWNIDEIALDLSDLFQLSTTQTRKIIIESVDYLFKKGFVVLLNEKAATKRKSNYQGLTIGTRNCDFSRFEDTSGNVELIKF